MLSEESAFSVMPFIAKSALVFIFTMLAAFAFKKVVQSEMTKREIKAKN